MFSRTRLTEQGQGLDPAANVQSQVSVLLYHSLDLRSYCRNNASPRKVSRKGRSDEIDAMDQCMRMAGNYFGQKTMGHLMS